jgi:hypothetical protein
MGALMRATDWARTPLHDPRSLLRAAAVRLHAWQAGGMPDSRQVLDSLTGEE